MSKTTLGSAAAAAAEGRGALCARSMADVMLWLCGGTGGESGSAGDVSPAAGGGGGGGGSGGGAGGGCSEGAAAEGGFATPPNRPPIFRL